ncbi:GNAT family N-acetyltransferase [Bartonella ancashensis]|uniref:GNAT family N-acetyltransferase n=1 Tax=Bartonella ancashensis TaxID=1318743 RepID=UPI001F2C3BC8|nr:N-acetyltransferase [Bartonella ancashensis]
MNSQLFISPVEKSSDKVTYWSEANEHIVQIEQINRAVFGPGRFVRASYLLRESGEHDRRFSFVACLENYVIGSVRMTSVQIGIQSAYLLGPLVVRPGYENSGIGSRLMQTVLQAVKDYNIGLIILVGNKEYYGRFGFKNVKYKQIHMPAPVEPQRLLALELQEGILKAVRGRVRYRLCD